MYKGGSKTTSPHGVDGISGGTITSDGVDEMLRRTLAIYYEFLSNEAQAAVLAAPAALEVAELTETLQTTEDQ